jgi:rhodanese-related sulfurtransferase
VRNAEVVLVSGTHVRAGITAYWLAGMGFSVSVLEGGVDAWAADGRPLVSGADGPDPVGADWVDERVTFLDPETLSGRLARDVVTVVDVDEGAAFIEGHVPGATWVPRYDLETDVESGTIDTTDPLVLTCRDGTRSAYVAAAVGFAFPNVTVTALRGGFAAWRDADLPVAEGDEGMIREPRTVERKPYGQGTREMRRYLEWEEGLVERE